MIGPAVSPAETSSQSTPPIAPRATPIGKPLSSTRSPRRGSSASPASEKMSRQTTIVATLGREILTGLHRPDHRLPTEVELRARFGVSRSVLREVMKTLAAKGLVAIKARIGARVTPTDAWRVFDRDVLEWRGSGGADAAFRREILEVRHALQPAAAALAAERRTAADMSRLYGALMDMTDAAGRGETFSTARNAFLEAVMTASHNPLMRSAASILEGAAVCSATGEAETWALACKGELELHERIVEQIAARDGASASAAMTALIHALHRS
jgi:DNA-binding FadR family transcriptional regulator